MSDRRGGVGGSLSIRYRPQLTVGLGVEFARLRALPPPLAPRPERDARPAHPADPPGRNAGHQAGKAPNQACDTGTAPGYPDAGVNTGGATVGLMYGSYQTYVALMARNVR